MFKVYKDKNNDIIVTQADIDNIELIGNVEDSQVPDEYLNPEDFTDIPKLAWDGKKLRVETEQDRKAKKDKKVRRKEVKDLFGGDDELEAIWNAIAELASNPNSPALKNLVTKMKG